MARSFLATMLLFGFSAVTLYAENTWDGWTIADGLGHDRVLDMEVDSMGRLWCVFETTGGVSIWDGTFWDTYSTDDGIPIDNSRSLIRTADGRMLVGTYGYGMYIIDSIETIDTATVYSEDNGLPDKYVYCIDQADDGSFWLGTHFSGLCHWYGDGNFESWNPENTPSMPASEIKALCVAGDGTIWMTTQNQSGGTQEIGHFDPITDTWTWWGEEEGIDGNKHAGIAEDATGAIWVSSYGSGAWRYDGMSWTQYTTAQGLTTDYLECLALAPDVAMWFAGYGGVSRFDGTDWQSWRVQTNDPVDPTAGLMNGWVSSIAFDGSDRVYFGNYAGGGVSMLEMSLSPTTAETAETGPECFDIVGNFPNPFNPNTVIRFTLITDEVVKLSIYNQAGQHVTTLASGTFSAGTHMVRWYGRNGTGQPVSTGVYYSVLRGEKNMSSHRMMLVK